MADIEIQQSKLHSISGTVIDAVTAQPINGGNVALQDDAGNAVDFSRRPLGDDGSFHYAFIPEGVYTLVIRNPQRVARDKLTMSGGGPSIGFQPPTRNINQAATPYADVAMPLIVQGDLTNVMVTATGKGAGQTAQGTR